MGKAWGKFAFAICLWSVAGNAEDPPGGHGGHAKGELKQGRYIGSIQLESSRKKIATVAEFFLESPEDLTKFPSLHASLRMSLGGYNTNEYITETFADLRYDFESGVLTLDDPKNDIVLTAEVHKMGGNNVIMGDVFIRSSALFGKIILAYETDEPGEGLGAERSASDNEPGSEVIPWVPALEGQYEGMCGEDKTVLQLQTVRGLKTVWQGEVETTSLSRYYGITARIGLKNSIMCGGVLAKGMWCTHYNYGGGSYNFYQGKLQLKGQNATDDCTVADESIKCQIRRTGFNRDCEFKKVGAKIKPAKFFTRRYNLAFSPEQLKDLPPAAPPKSPELSAAVRGTFTGYVHNETNDTYQFMQLHVMPFHFTENTHNPNQMMVTTTATLHLGPDATSPFVSQRFEPRSFYLRPGFTLTAPTTDTYLNVTEWKKGLIRGTLYSKAFGKVGTVQLLKGKAPAPAAGMEIVRSFVGEFDGPVNEAGVSAGMRWFRFLFPAQPNDLSDQLVRFSGSYNPVTGITGVRNIDRGTFDMFTGNFGWIIENDFAATFSTGVIDKSGAARMYWPPAPGVFGTYMSDFVPEVFRKK